MVRKLHIGGKQAKAGWEILNAMDGPHVDHVGNAKDLSFLQDGLFDELYASHILEHLDYKEEIDQALSEWFRVLTPGGRLKVSVPDMDILCQMFLARDQLDVQQRFQIMRLIFGGHEHEWDYHMVGLNEDILSVYLTNAGFVELTRVRSLGLFDDTSEKRVAGVPISVNMIAEKPKQQIL